MTRNILCAAVLAAVLAPAAAAESPPVRQIDQAPKGQVIRDRPYSATETVTQRTLLADGNEIKTETVTRIHRDSAGRLRRERVGGEAIRGGIQIVDEHGEIYVLDPATKSAVRPASMTGITVYGKNGPEVRGGGQGVTPERLAQFKAELVAKAQLESNRTMTELGEREIAGFKAKGRRHAFEIAAGAAGNRHPIEVSSEDWTTDELRIALYRKRSDPRSGETETVLSDIERGEPDPALFQIPDDYQRHANVMGVNAP